MNSSPHRRCLGGRTTSPTPKRAKTGDTQIARTVHGQICVFHPHSGRKKQKKKVLSAINFVSSTRIAGGSNRNDTVLSAINSVTSSCTAGGRNRDEAVLSAMVYVSAPRTAGSASTCSPCGHHVRQSFLFRVLFFWRPCVFFFVRVPFFFGPCARGGVGG